MNILIIVDYQNDFMPTGSLPVPKSDELIGFINSKIPKYDLVVTTQDWHPRKHCSFKDWPEHCIQNTIGAQLNPFLELVKAKNHLNWQKGYDPNVDSYSAFIDANDGSTYLYTKLYHITKNDLNLSIVGVATEFCVKFTALNAVQGHSNSVTVFKDGIAGLDKADEAIEEMKNSGIIIL